MYIHDHLVSAVGSQKVSCLCLLDLSAAFDTIDHDILITRLSSWFGIHGSVLSWFKSYLSSCRFRVRGETNLSSWYTSWCPQGSVLGPLLFVMYTIPLSNLFYSCLLNHNPILLSGTSSIGSIDSLLLSTLHYTLLCNLFHSPTPFEKNHANTLYELLIKSVTRIPSSLPTT